MSPVYLDNAATTRVLPEVMDAVSSAAQECFANPSSLHSAGANARRLVESVRASLAASIGVDASEMIFTSGGTESNNLVIRGLPRLKQGGRALVSSVEHPSVYSQVSWLEAQGLVVDEIPVDANGVVALDVFESMLCSETRIVAVMAVNNEIGTIQPVREIARLAKAKNPDVHVHCDAVQAFGKTPLDARSMQLDSMALSAHKIHGPKGIGALYLRKDRGINPLTAGGSQESKTRPGTENVPGIAGFGAALSLLQRERAAFKARAERMRKKLWELLEGQEGIYPLVPPDACVPYIVPVRVEGCSSETLLHFLEQEGLWVSSGSACHGSAEPTHVLKALGYEGDPGSFRASFALDTPEDSVEQLAQALAKVVPIVRQVCASR